MIAQIPPYTWEYRGEGGEFLYDKNYNTVNTEYIIKRGGTLRNLINFVSILFIVPIVQGV